MPDIIAYLRSLKVLDKCTVQVDSDKVQIPDGLELSLDGDYCIRLGRTPLVWSDEKNAQAEYNRIKSAFENGNYRLTISLGLEPKLEILG